MRNPLLGLALFVVAFALPELAFGQSRQSSYVWNQTSLTGNNLQADFGRIVAHPTNPNVIYLCTMSSLDPISGVPGPADGIWKSSDLGVTWTVLSDAVMSPDYSILGLAISESSPDTLYVSTKEYGVFKSTDGGISWAAMNNGLPFPNGNHSGVAIAVDPADADKVYVSVAQTDGLDIFNLTSQMGIQGQLSPPALLSFLSPRTMSYWEWPRFMSTQSFSSEVKRRKLVAKFFIARTQGPGIFEKQAAGFLLTLNKVLALEPVWREFPPPS